MAWRFSPLFVAPVFAGLVFVASPLAFGAGTQPSNRDWFQNEPPASAPAATVTGTTSGRDFDTGAMPPAPPAPPPQARVPQQFASGQSDFPVDQVHDWVLAYARNANARAMFHRAENELDNAVRNARFNFEQSKEYAQAAAEEKKAYDAYAAGRRQALKSVVNDPKYVAAIELRDQLGGQIARLRAQARGARVPVPHDMLLAMASQKLQYATDAHNMESAALDRDGALGDARQRMVEANAKVNGLRADFDASIRNNSQVLEARRNIEDARVALITSEAYLNAAATAGALAADYSYYRHRWDGLVGPQITTAWGPGYGY